MCSIAHDNLLVCIHMSVCRVCAVCVCVCVCVSVCVCVYEIYIHTFVVDFSVLMFS